MSCASKSRLQSLYPFLVNKRAGLVRHGDYADGQRNVGSWSPALPDALEHALTSGNVVLCFGQIKPYKNVERLIDVFRELKDAQLRLCIVGKVSPPEYADRLSARAAQDPRIVLFDARVEEDLLRAVIRRARLVVLPYRRILNSGSILLSMGCATPVLAPSVDTVLELAADVGHGWIRTFSDELTDDDLLQAIDAGRPPVAPDMCLFRWSRVAEALAQLYRSAR